MSLASISAYREYDSYFANDNDLSPLASSLGYGNLHFYSFSQELRLASTGEGAFQWLVGAFYQEADRDYSQTLPTPGYDAILPRGTGAPIT